MPPFCAVPWRVVKAPVPAIVQNHYVLAVHDLARSSRFFVEMLGFEVVREPPGWISVARERRMIMLGEFPVRTPDGHRLMIGQPIGAA